MTPAHKTIMKAHTNSNLLLLTILKATLRMMKSVSPAEFIACFLSSAFLFFSYSSLIPATFDFSSFTMLLRPPFAGWNMAGSLAVKESSTTSSSYTSVSVSSATASSWGGPGQAFNGGATSAGAAADALSRSFASSQAPPQATGRSCVPFSCAKTFWVSCRKLSASKDSIFFWCSARSALRSCRRPRSNFEENASSGLSILPLLSGS
mmetsp:Transcript_10821/g.19228  ORF Transcript_10821/g.19228 Transcript_10821/m.19228 type:complete len:207 (+) Transcript_10821:1140-1760(+)